MNADSKHGISPYRVALEHAQAALLAAVTRNGGGPNEIELGQSAARVSYVKSLVVKQYDGEDDFDWVQRAAALLTMATAHLPVAPESPSEPPTPIRKPRGRRTA